jgi:hypothetical protein
VDAAHLARHPIKGLDLIVEFLQLRGKAASYPPQQQSARSALASQSSSKARLQPAEEGLCIEARRHRRHLLGRSLNQEVAGAELQSAQPASFRPLKWMMAAPLSCLQSLLPFLLGAQWAPPQMLAVA